jgi:hypothetical protein
MLAAWDGAVVETMAAAASMEARIRDFMVLAFQLTGR